MRLLFTYLVAFSADGGIQRFNRAFIYALHSLHTRNEVYLKLSSPYDKSTDPKYVPSQLLTPSANRFSYFFDLIRLSYSSDVIVFGHINQSLAGLLVKLIFPRKKVVLIAHGIEVWRNLSFTKKLFLKQCNKLLAVSQFTKDSLVRQHGVSAAKIDVFYNTLDPFFKIPDSFERNKSLLAKHGINENQKIVLTVARLSSTEKYKGYDYVIKAMAEIRDYDIRYFLVGKYDDKEFKRLKKLINDYRIDDKVILVGYVDDETLGNYYSIADVFVMPSKKEGFGIVFIEAMVRGLKVIAGNKDGSVDALQNGKFGVLINPDNEEEIKNAIVESLKANYTIEEKQKLQQNVIEVFGSEEYIQRLKNVLNALKY